MAERPIDTIVDEAMGALERLISLDANRLSEVTGRFGTDFTRAADPLRRTQRLATSITPEILRACAAANVMETVRAHADQIIHSVNVGLGLAPPQPSMAPANLYATLVNTCDALTTNLLPTLGASAALGIDPRAQESLDALMRKADARREASEKQAKDVVVMIERLGTEANAVVAEIRQHAAVAVVSVHAAAFNSLAEEHEKAGDRWLWATAITTIVVGVSMALSLVCKPISDDAKSGTIAQYAITRAALLVLASYAIVWCSRNYRAHRHLAVMNRHRKTALATFETFIDSTTHAETRNAVLLETTRSIFSSGSTGYIVSEADGGGGPESVVQIVKAAGGLDGKV